MLETCNATVENSINPLGLKMNDNSASYVNHCVPATTCIGENFHTELYPTEGEIGDREAGLLVDAGVKLPLIPKAVYKLDAVQPETIDHSRHYDATTPFVHP